MPYDEAPEPETPDHFAHIGGADPEFRMPNLVKKEPVSQQEKLRVQKVLKKAEQVLPEDDGSE